MYFRVLDFGGLGFRILYMYLWFLLGFLGCL